MAYKVLLVEDDEQIIEVISDFFENKDGGLKLTTATDGQSGLDLIYEHDFDLIMLDVMLPGIDGFSICREIRRKSIVPILFLTARSREEDVLYGYSIGCDDYIIKPFSLAALYAKAEALIKRSKGMVLSHEMTCGEILLDPVTQTVKVSGKETDLPPKEYALLKYLMSHKDWVIDRDTLLTRVWGADYFGSDRVVDNHIKKLRKALGSAGGQIKTVVTKGYKITDN